MEWDVFISHASEDKNTFVIPLAMKLSELKVKVWFDMFTLKVGDRLSRSIDRGLANSNFGIVVISKAFIKKNWTEYELQGLVSKELGRSKVILPIWHDITREDILKFSPTLADKYALLTENSAIDEIAYNLLEVIRPDIFSNLQRIAAEAEMRRNLPVKKVSISDLRLRKSVRHESLPPELLVRIKLIQRILYDVFPISLDKTLYNFLRDQNPDKELLIWEKIVATYLDITSGTLFSLEQRKEIYSILLILSTGGMDEEFLNTLKYFDENNIVEFKHCYFNVVPEIPKNFDDLY